MKAAAEGFAGLSAELADGAPLGRRGYLMLRRGGGVWGVESAAVTSLVRQERGERSAAAYRVGTAGEPLAADEILGVAAELDVRRPARAVLRWWPAGSDGCALWSGLPVAVVDARQPPLALRLSAAGAGEKPAGETVSGAKPVPTADGQPGGEAHGG